MAFIFLPSKFEKFKNGGRNEEKLLESSRTRKALEYE
jgi:hypothetical protein